MRTRVIKYVIASLLLFLLGFKSVYFRKLDEVKVETATKIFDARSFARNFYDNKLLPRADSALDLRLLISLLKTDPKKAFETYSNALAIGNIRYFLIRGEGTIKSISDDAVNVQLSDESENTNVQIATEFIYGNAIRDASGLLRLSDFDSNAQGNSISESINTIIRNEVLPIFVAKAKPGTKIKFTGAIELNQKYLSIQLIEVTPIHLVILE